MKIRKIGRVIGVIGIIGLLAAGCGNASESRKTSEHDKDAETEQTIEESNSYSMGQVTYYKKNAVDYEAAMDKAASGKLSKLSREDLENDEVICMFDEDNRLQLINGNYTEQTVENVQQAYESLYVLEDLLDLEMSRLIAFRSYEEEAGTYYTFGIEDYDNFQQGCVVHLIVDARNQIQGLTVECNGENVTTTGNSKSIPDYVSNPFFENLIAATAQAVDMNGDEVSVPVMYNEQEDTYYLGDLQRKIVVGVYTEHLSNQAIYPFLSSKDNSWDDPEAVTVLRQLMEVYDYYVEQFGWYSVDGCGIPIMFYVHADYDGMSNADYAGIARDYAWFDISDEFVGMEWILAHEFCHGVFMSNSMGSIGMNETGSLSEGYADIFGALASKEIQDTKVDWYRRGTDYYDMCPSAVGDGFYWDPVGCVTKYNDYGGTHFNSALLVRAAANMEQKGLPVEEIEKIWWTSLQFMTSKAGYKQLEQYVLIAARLHDVKSIEQVEETFTEAGISVDMKAGEYLNHIPKGCGKIEIAKSTPDNVVMDYVVISDQNFSIKVLSENEDGKVESILPVGHYRLAAIETNIETQDEDFLEELVMEVTITEGQVCVVE